MTKITKVLSKYGVKYKAVSNLGAQCKGGRFSSPDKVVDFMWCNLGKGVVEIHTAEPPVVRHPYGENWQTGFTKYNSHYSVGELTTEVGNAKKHLCEDFEMYFAIPKAECMGSDVASLTGLPSN
jgi:hypothetical protein